jgi:hydrogenase 3 maturation protease
MSENRWRSRLTKLLARETGGRSVVVIGLGHPLKGDDYVGSLIAKDLRKRIRNTPGVVIVDAEDSPENVLRVLNQEKPRLVVLIDSVEAGLEPGSVTLMDLSDTTYPYFGSHNMPLKVLLEMSPEILKTVLLGVQPSSYGIGGPLSTEVAHAEAEIVIELGSIFEKMKG